MVVVLLIYIYTKLYLEYYFRLLLNVYNMEAINIKKKKKILVPHDKFLTPPQPTYLKKKIPGAATDDQHISPQSGVQTKCSPLQILDLLGCTQLLLSPATIQVFFNNY